jgi:uncharacterized protein YuzB (UPF0349 family)
MLTISVIVGRIKERRGEPLRPIIEFCTSNLASGTEWIMKELEKYPELDVVEYGCLGNCGECFAHPYALVNGEIVSADTPDELLDKIKQELIACCGLDLNK